MARTPYQRPKFAAPVPKCATFEQTDAWIKTAGGTNMKLPVCGFCSDCLPGFQARMIEQGRCENPGVQFVVSIDDGISGVLHGN